MDELVSYIVTRLTAVAEEAEPTFLTFRHLDHCTDPVDRPVVDV